jgi:hypothetical protein
VHALRTHGPFARDGRAIVLGFFFLLGAQAQVGPPGTPRHSPNKKSGAALPKISLTPRFVPGQSFRYEMEFETTNETSRKGLATDPQGPSSVVMDWNAAVRIDILPAGEGRPGAMVLKATYEKSTASVRSDTFDPTAEETSEQYRQLEGKTIEFMLGADGKVSKIAGLEGMVESEKTAQAARDWISQLGASTGAPAGGVSVGQTWSSEQPATSLPIAGLVWRADSEYLGNESCHPANPDVPPGAGATAPSANGAAAPDCAVILAKLSLIRPKSARETTPPELRQEGVESSGKWAGSSQSLLYVSLETGLVVGATETGSEEMDVTLTSSHNTSLRYAGTISTRSHITLVANEKKE